MKNQCLRPLLRLLPALVILVAGCATDRPTVSAWRDSQFMLTRADQLALTRRPNPSPQDAELNRLLVAELKREGFELVPIEKADYLLACVCEDDLVEHEQNRITTPALESDPQTTQQILMPSQSPPSSTGPANGFSTPVVFHSYGIRLFVYTNPKTHAGRFELAWQGYIAAGGSVSAEHETALVKTLLGYLGKEQHGPVNLAQ